MPIDMGQAMSNKKCAKSRAHINRDRCLYTGRNLDPASTLDEYIPSEEHIIPLALGGLDSFIIPREVSKAANTRAGNEIDDRLARHALALGLRQKYRLVGHRKTLPTFQLDGEFVDIKRSTWLKPAFPI